MNCKDNINLTVAAKSTPRIIHCIHTLPIVRYYKDISTFGECPVVADRRMFLCASLRYTKNKLPPML
uniref:Uncharacterized protein n=1 Tax=Megaselia scalaris TaxID=36166 RepID=T1GDG6_MEGSC